MTDRRPVAPPDELIDTTKLGVLGALLAIPIAAAVQLVVNEVGAPRQDQS